MLTSFGPSTWVAVIVGTLLAIGAFVPVAAVRYRRAGRLRFVDVVLLLAVAVYSVALWSYTLVPIPENDQFACVRQNWVPFQFVADVAASRRAPLHNAALLQAVFNVIFFLPLGGFLRLFTRLGTAVITAIGFATSLLIESTQGTGVWGLFCCAYRTFDVDDLLLNTSGALLGSLLALPVVRLVRRRRPAPAVTRVTLGRRFIGMAADLFVIALLGGALTVAWRAAAIFGLGWPATELPVWVDQVLGVGVPALVELYWVLARGQTIGEDVVRIEPMQTGGSRPSTAARLVKYAAGVGGYCLLSVALVPDWLLPVFALLTVGWAVWSRDHRGLSHALAKLEVRIDTGRPLHRRRRELPALVRHRAASPDRPWWPDGPITSL